MLIFRKNCFEEIRSLEFMSQPRIEYKYFNYYLYPLIYINKIEYLR